MFLDMKSTYPSVHHNRLLNTIQIKESPKYLVQLIFNFLTDRITSLQREDFLSCKFEITDGLPQGSPISAILYLIYNLRLLIQKPISLDSQLISVGFIDDITHLVAKKDMDWNIEN